MNESAETTKTYTNGDITVIWQPNLCRHAMHCFTELPSVFNPKARPWVNMDGAPSERITVQTGRCPSGALSSKRAAD